MEYETKHWIVRWTSIFDYRNKKPLNVPMSYGRIYDSQFQALKHYRKLMNMDIVSVHIIRQDVQGNEYIISKLDKALPVGFREA